MIRIVKLTFEADKTNDFLLFFDSIKHVVNNFPGCNGMKLLQDIHTPNIVMTYSLWNGEQDLENYRVSPEFKQIWGTIKPWFAQKAEAWSVEPYFDGFAEKC